MILFSLSLATAILFSQISHGQWIWALREQPFAISTILQTSVSLLALAVLRFPRSRVLLSLLCSSLIATCLWLLPAVPNHRLTLLIVCCVTLLACLTHIGHGPLTNRMPSSLRCTLWSIVVLLYGFAFFHKLNTDFIAIDTSCAVQFLGNIVPKFDSWLEESLSRRIGHFLSVSAVWGTLFFEFLIIPFLLFPSTRKPAVIAGVLFHVILALDMRMHFIDFSSVMICLLLSFVSVHNQQRTGLDGDQPRAWFITILFAVMFALVVLGIAIGQSHAGYWLFAHVRQVVWLVGASWLIICLVSSATGEKLSEIRWSSSGLVIVGVIFMITNGLGPYLGYKTRTAFAMYSNLRITETNSNHFLVPASADVFGLLADRVKITGPEEGESLMVGVEFPYTSIVQLTELQRPGTKVEFSYEGQTYHYPQDPLPKQSSWWTRKLTYFQPIGDKAAGDCFW